MLPLMLAAQNSWQPRPGPDPNERSALQASLGCSTIVADWLCRRGQASPDQAQKFMAKRLKDLVDPAALADATRASKRLAQAINDRQRIMIHGDFDVDGCTAAALLAGLFELLDCPHRVHIPRRLDDGYGISAGSLAAAEAYQPQVFITVDCGISDSEWLPKIAHATGCTTIVSDHHLPGRTLPSANFVVNPNRGDCTSRANELAGVGVAWMIAWATARELCGDNELPANMRTYLLDSLALVALGSVADCAPLINNNRILVHHGLKALERTTLPGLKALLQSCDLWGQPLTANDVSWKLSPLLNAAGRLGEADHTIELLCATDDASAKKLANQLHKDNEQRRRLTSVLADDLKSQVSAMQELPEGLVFAGEGWHPGVIGIAAARICEDHQRPTAVIAVNDGIGRGSLRAPPGLRLDQALDDCRDLLISGGGHAAAAGLSISIDNIPLFSERFAAAIASQQPDGAQASPLVYDCRAAIGDLNGDFFADLQRLGPFGHGNPEPTLLIERACINGKPNCFGKKGDHLRAALTDPHGGMRQLLAWNLGERLNAFLQPNAAFDLIVRPERNWYRGELYPQLVLVDGRLQ